MQKILLTTALCGALAFSLFPTDIAAAQDQNTQTPVVKTTQSPDQAVQQVSDAVQAKIVQSAVEALTQTGAALKALQDKDTDKALEALAGAIGKLELVTSADPDLSLVPVDVNERLYDLYADAKIVDAVREDAIKFLREGNVPAARQLLSNLASELVVETTSIPLGFYPDSLKQVVQLVRDNKVDEAVTALKATLDTLVVNTVAIPLPTIRAGIAVDAARELADSDQKLSDEQIGQVNALLDEARDQLRLSVALGYAERGSLKPLHQDIEQVRRLVKTGKKGELSFKHLLKNLKDKSDKNKDEVNKASK